MKKLSFLVGVLSLTLFAGSALANGYALDDPLAAPPTADQILDATVGAVVEPTPALPGIGSDETTTVVTEAESPFVGFGATVIYENSLGIGSFVPDEYQRRTQWDMLWSLRAKLYLFHKLMFMQARIDLNQPIIDHADSATTENNEFTISDTIITFIAPSFYKEPVTKLRFGAWMDFLFPTSLESRYSSLLVGWRTGVSVGRTFGPVDISYQFRFTKNFHDDAAPTLRFDQYGAGTVTGTSYRNRGPGGELGEGILTDYSLMNRLTVTVEFLEQFYASLDFIIFNSFHYDTNTADTITDPVTGAVIQLDSSPYAQPGRGQVDLTQATLEIGWTPIQYLTVALGVTSYQPPVKDDNGGLRFPISFSEASQNFTTLYLDVIGTY